MFSTDWKINVIKILAIALVPFAIAFGYLTYSSTVALEFSPYRLVPFEDCFVGQLKESDAPEDLIFRELWIRNIVPPPISTFCYTGQDVCGYLECVNDQIGWDLADYNNWHRYSARVGLASIPALFVAIFLGALAFSGPSNAISLEEMDASSAPRNSDE